MGTRGLLRIITKQKKIVLYRSSDTMPPYLGKDLINDLSKLSTQYDLKQLSKMFDKVKLIGDMTQPTRKEKERYKEKYGSKFDEEFNDDGYYPLTEILKDGYALTTSYYEDIMLEFTYTIDFKNNRFVVASYSSKKGKNVKFYQTSLDSIIEGDYDHKLFDFD